MPRLLALGRILAALRFAWPTSWWASWYIFTGYDVTIYFRSEATAKIPSKMPPRTASGGISRERFKRGSPNFTRLSGTTVPTNQPDMTPLITSGRLQNSIKYCTKVTGKTCPAGQIVKYFDGWLNQTRHMLHGHLWWPNLRPHRIWRHQLLPIGIYQSSKNGRKCRPRRLWSNFSGAAFCLPHQMVGIISCVLYLKISRWYGNENT